MPADPTSRAAATVADQPHHHLPTVHIADRRGITAAGAVALAIAMGVVGGTIDVITGEGLRLVFAIFFAVGCVLAAAVIHREDLLAAVVIPPLAYLALALLAGAARGAGSGESVVRQQFIELSDALIISFPALGSATAAAALVAVVRWAGTRNRSPRQ